MLPPLGALVLFKEYVTLTPRIFASYSGASPCKMDCHWGVALRKIFYQEWCVSTRKTWTLQLSSMRMVLYEIFSGLQKVTWLLLYFGLFILLVWAHLSEKWLFSFFMVSDQRSTPMTLCMFPSPPHSPFPLTPKMFWLNLFLQERNFIALNLSRLFYRWSYGVLLYEIFTIGKLLGRLPVQPF